MAGTQLDILDLLASTEGEDHPPDLLPRLVGARIFIGHRRRWALLQHQCGSLALDGLIADLGGPFGGAGHDDDLWLSWATRRSGVDVDWRRGGSGHREHLPWPVVIRATLDGLSPSEAADLDAAETARRAARAAAEAKFARLALHDDAGNPVLWVAWDTSSGLKAGTLLDLNHGLAPHHPDSLNWTTCAMQDRAVRRAMARESAA